MSPYTCGFVGAVDDIENKYVLMYADREGSFEAAIMPKNQLCNNKGEAEYAKLLPVNITSL